MAIRRPAVGDLFSYERPDRDMRPTQASKIQQHILRVLQLVKIGLPGGPFTVSIQKVAVTSAETALGPCAGVPCRNAVMEVPPTTGRIGWVETLSTVVFRTVRPVKAVVRTESGLFTIAWVTPISPEK
jgi:hypothetical protein